VPVELAETLVVNVQAKSKVIPWTTTATIAIAVNYYFSNNRNEAGEM